jgi:phosphoglycolate phosphatase
MPLRLALFDCDGTLADSQHHIVSAMGDAFAALNLPPPPAQAVRMTIGLSLPGIAAALLPDGDAAAHERLVDAYRDAYFAARTAAGAAPEPLYDGIMPLLDTLATDGWALGIATGKSHRGLVRLLEAHGICRRFLTLQTADGHPSKPDPSMALTAMQEVGAAPANTVVIGDTAFDMVMARKAGARAIGVSWGYHPVEELLVAGASSVADDPADLPAMLATVLEPAL